MQCALQQNRQDSRKSNLDFLMVQIKEAEHQLALQGLEVPPEELFLLTHGSVRAGYYWNLSEPLPELVVAKVRVHLLEIDRHGGKQKM